MIGENLKKKMFKMLQKLRLMTSKLQKNVKCTFVSKFLVHGIIWVMHKTVVFANIFVYHF